MQIVEPDLGSDPGNPEQRRQAVPGRVIESNIAFTVSNGAALRLPHDDLRSRGHRRAV